MSIRIRRVDDHLVAICAARSTERPGDIYLDDGVHYALAQKFWHDYRDFEGMTVDEADIARRVQEEDNLEWWNKEYGVEQ